MKVTDELYQKIVNHCSTAYLSTDKKYIPSPTTYLNGEKWEDEIILSNQPINQKTRSRGDELAEQARSILENNDSPICENGGFIPAQMEIGHRKL